eukprot:5585336-Amphidinium_carterae.1
MAGTGPAEENQEHVDIPSGTLPVRPSAAEVQQHEDNGHLPYRNWCPMCVATKGFGNPHVRAPSLDEEHTPVVSMDYGFMNPDTESVPFLTVKDNRSRMTWSTLVPQKGVVDYNVS